MSMNENCVLVVTKTAKVSVSVSSVGLGLDPAGLGLCLGLPGLGLGLGLGLSGLGLGLGLSSLGLVLVSDSLVLMTSLWKSNLLLLSLLTAWDLYYAGDYGGGAPAYGSNVFLGVRHAPYPKGRDLSFPSPQNILETLPMPRWFELEQICCHNAWGSSLFLGVQHTPVLWGRAPALPKIFVTYMHAQSMRNNN